MATATRGKGLRRLRRGHVQRPSGTMHPRVQAVGPQRFGIVAIDCAKARSKWMLANFFGAILVPPTEVPHCQPRLRQAIETIRAACKKHGIADVIVAIERTGEYHQPVRRAFIKAGFEIRIVHPFATKQFRQVADPGNKTDDTDLVAILCAATNGFGLIELPLDPLSEQLRLLGRHRRDLVEKSSALHCQIREHLGAAMPGYAECFGDFWESKPALLIARQTGSAQAVIDAGVNGLAERLVQAKLRYQRRSLEKILAWARTAPPADPQAPLRQQIWIDLDDDRLGKRLKIKGLESQLAALLVRTDYLRLLAIPGINVVSAAELAGEMGPISHYANSKAIAGRAGLFPSRHQSDRVDHHNGPLLRCANRRLRAAILRIADNLISCNDHFRQRHLEWKLAGRDPRASRVRVGNIFSRIAFVLVAGRQPFRHPSMQKRSYVLDKLLAFYAQHDTHMSQRLADLQLATEQIPNADRRAEARPLADQLQTVRASRRRQPTPLADILPVVLAKLGVNQLQSLTSGDQDPS